MSNMDTTVVSCYGWVVLTQRADLWTLYERFNREGRLVESWLNPPMVRIYAE